MEAVGGKRLAVRVNAKSGGGEVGDGGALGLLRFRVWRCEVFSYPLTANR